MLASREVDYRIIYMSEREVGDRIHDVYRGLQTELKPPIFLEILREMVDVEASLFLMHHPEAFDELTEVEIERLQNSLAEEEPSAIHFVCERINQNFLELFTRDLYYYLIEHNLFFVEQDLYSKNITTLHNQSVRSVW